MAEDKKIDKFKKEVAYQKASNKLNDVILLYEDKTYILFGSQKKKKRKGI